MASYSLSVAYLLAMACDCIRRGDLDGAQAALARAAVLSRGGGWLRPLGSTAGAGGSRGRHYTNFARRGDMVMKKTTQKLLAEMRKAYDLVQERRPDEAVQVYRVLLAGARTAGLDSAHLHYAYAIACDYSGDLEMAFEQISAAVAKDPLALPFRHSFDIVVNRIKAALADEERAADDASTPRLYALLQRAGAADLAAHLAIARYHLAKGQLAEARSFADAVVLLHGGAREASVLKAAVAEAAGEGATADASRLEAAALPDGEPVFAAPGAAAA